MQSFGVVLGCTVTCGVRGSFRRAVGDGSRDGPEDLVHASSPDPDLPTLTQRHATPCLSTYLQPINCDSLKKDTYPAKRTAR